MQYNDENRQGLMSLLAASQAGLDPTTAYGMIQNIQADQEAQLAQRRERQSGLIGLLMEAAQGGMPYAGASAMMEAAPGPMGPALQSALDSMYPSGAPQPAPTNANGAVMDFPAGSRPTPSGLTPAMGPSQMQYQVPVSGPQSTSPAFVPPQPSVAEQQSMMEMEQQQAQQADLTALQMDAAQARAQEWTVDDFIAKASQENPALFATAPDEVMAIIQNTFGEQAVATRGLAIG